MGVSKLTEDSYNEEWWQPEMHCGVCGNTFMYSRYPDFPEYPTFCPNCGIKFDTIVRRGEFENETIYNFPV
ncbi:MAG: hypothetical protein J6S67_13120 [Methanobrevibacter sp.]|nr:hypothetical protein [Methanobrevibacter sp.]